MDLNAISRAIGGCISNTVVSETFELCCNQRFLFYYTIFYGKAVKKNAKTGRNISLDSR